MKEERKKEQERSRHLIDVKQKEAFERKDKRAGVRETYEKGKDKRARERDI